MNRSSISFATCTACLVLASIGPASRADYALNGGENLGTFRIHDDGVEVGAYFPPANARNLVETFGEDYAVTPDLSTVYQFTNSLGQSNYEFVYDVNSYAYLPNKLLQTGGFPDATIWNAWMGLIRPSDPTGKGDLFVISGRFGFGGPPNIKRFNCTTSSPANYIESIDPPSTQGIIDFGFGPDNRLYMAAQNGIYVYQESISGFSLVSSTPLLGSLTGNITFGPDGNLYLRDSVSGDVNRYSTAGTFINTFIPAATIPGSASSIQFGVDGNLHMLIGSGEIGKYSGTSGNLLKLINFAGPGPTFFWSAQGRVTYVPVPEPSSLVLAIMGAVAIGLRRSLR